mmetsp:Transcript_20562/g.61303  ORF Transcript_20562/g.61303 Transcript_20562/m.61303 type:complete len:221 (-) Transcript_20562:8-670(-)
MLRAARIGDRLSRSGGAEYAKPSSAEPASTRRSGAEPRSPRTNAAPRQPSTVAHASRSDSSPDATGRCGLFTRSMSISQSWFRPVMNTFMSSAGVNAVATEAAQLGERHAPSVGAAYACRAGTATAVPTNVWGRVKRHSVRARCARLRGSRSTGEMAALMLSALRTVMYLCSLGGLWRACAASAHSASAAKRCMVADGSLGPRDRRDIGARGDEMHSESD